MNLSQIICIVIALCTVFSLVSCSTKNESGNGTTTPEVTTPEVTTPEITTPEATAPSTDVPDDFVIPTDGKFTLGDGTNGLSFPFAAGILTGLQGDNYALSAMEKLSQLNFFTKTVTPIGGFVGNWMLTHDSKLDMFTAGNYGDIQMFYHTSEGNWVFGPFASKGQVIVIRFTAPADGTYSYTVAGRDWTASSSGAVMDVHIGENMHNWWDMFRYTGRDHGSYVERQTSSSKELTAGTNVYFILRAQGMDTVTAISEFVVNYTPAA